MKSDYFRFPLDFLASFFDATGAVFDAGATTFFALFDVVITSFLSRFLLIVVFSTYSCSSGTVLYALFLYRNLNDFKRVFL